MNNSANQGATASKIAGRDYSGLDFVISYGGAFFVQAGNKGQTNRFEPRALVPYASFGQYWAQAADVNQKLSARRAPWVARLREHL